MERMYLGDSVYAEIDTRGLLLLTTYNGYPDDPRNKIYLELEVMDNLKDYMAMWAEELKMTAELARDEEACQ